MQMHPITSTSDGIADAFNCKKTVQVGSLLLLALTKMMKWDGYKLAISCQEMGRVRDFGTFSPRLLPILKLDLCPDSPRICNKGLSHSMKKVNHFYNIVNHLLQIVFCYI